MKKNLPQRKNIRLKYYDYSTPGLYFVTICIKNRREILGHIKYNDIKLTKEGYIARKNIKKIFEGITIDEYVIMPNHIHMLISLDGQNEVTLSRIIKQYKGVVTKQIGYSIWQKLYYEHVIRNEKEYYIVKEYIRNNIINWEKDKYF